MSSAETFVSSASPLDQPSSQPDEIGKSELQFELFLINLMKKSEPLYCSDHPDYNNSGKNRLAWLMIAEKCKKTVPQCQRKWHSLLRIYYSLPRENTWIHRSSFSEFEPYLTHNKLQNPTKVQREVLLKELLACNSELMSYESTTNENCWLKVISKCNAILPGVIMSVINWQKCWLYMKQNFGCALYTMRSRFEASIKISDKFTPEELSMIRICRATPSDSMSNIVAALGNNLELGPNRECVIFKCKKCQQQKDEILLNGYCSNCCPKPKFCNICEIGGGMVRYKLSTWSKKALDILPTNLRSSIEITVCHPCNSTLKKEATHIWKICRVCQSQKPPLESLYVNTSTTNLKKAFKDAIKFEFKEDDGLPGFICTSCISQMTKLTSFVNRFKRVQHRLYQVHSTNFIGSFYENEKLSQPLEEQEQISEDFEAILPDTDIESNISDLLTRGKKRTPKKITKVNKTIQKNSEIIPVQIIPAQISTNAGDTMPITSTEPEIAIKDVYSLTQSIERVQFGQAPKLNAVPIAAGQFASEEGMKTSSQTSFPQRLLTKQNEFLNFPSKPQQDNNSMNLKPSTASKPAIFTISEFGKLKEILSGSAKPPITPIETDFESLEDEPPAFCIPKHRENSDNSIDLTSNPSTIIKDEKTDDDVDDDGNVVCTPDINLEMESTPPPPTLPAGSLYTFPEVTKVVSIKGVLVTVIPHPYIIGAWTPIGPNGKMPQSGPLPVSTPVSLPVSNKVSTPVSLPVSTPVISKKKPPLSPPQPKTIVQFQRPNIIQQKFEEKMTLEIPASGKRVIKKPRRYWGNVDEFIVSPLSKGKKTHLKLKAANVQIKHEILKNDKGDNYPGSKNQVMLNSIIKKPINPLKRKRLRINVKRDRRIREMLLKCGNLGMSQ